MSQLTLNDRARMDIQAIVGSSEFRRLHARRERIRWVLAIAAFGIAGAFTVLMAFFPNVLTAPIAPRSAITWGIVITPVCLLSGVAVAAAYIHAAERYFGNEQLSIRSDE